MERAGGESGARARIRELLAGGTHATSTHVLREWKHIIHLSAVRILNAADDADSVDDVRARLRHGFGRQPAHNWLAFDMIEGQATSVAELQVRAEQFLRVRADVLFELDIEEVRDGSECMLAKETAATHPQSGEWSLRTMCRRQECDCQQIQLTDAQAARIDAAASALALSTVSGHRTMARTAKTAMAASDKTHRKGKACWGANGLGGDISIALECRDDEVLLTTDASFDHICPAIGVRHRRLPGTRTV